MKLTASHYKAFSRITGCCFFMLFTLALKAQTRGTVEVVQDPLIDTLMARRLHPTKAYMPAGGAMPGSNGTISSDGYRIQFFTGPSRADAYAAQNKLKARFPEMHTYISYKEPNFKVHAGDFRTRMDASRAMQQLRPYFPVLFIIAEKINPQLNEQN